jgi:hypothetical protein
MVWPNIRNMKFLNNFVPNGKTRAKLTVCCLIANFALAGLGIIMKSSITDLGTGLALLNSPLYVYILAQSIRPSKIEPEVVVEETT